jgi:XTP/dITP diphosphohydrolase
VSARRVLVATRNAGKLHELRPLLAGAGFVPIDLGTVGIPETAAEDDLESHDSFEANALAKARYFAGLAGGLPVLADDSGLSVRALGGAPGVHSKRWSGETALAGRELDQANNRKLLRSLAGVGDGSAAYVCAAAWVDGRRELVRVGEVRGRIVMEARGVEGFGYDPHFWSEELGRTFGESSREEKARVSHRARAVRALLAAVAERAVPGESPRVGVEQSAAGGTGEGAVDVPANGAG